MKTKDLPAKDRLMIYVRGWKKGASGSAYTPTEMANKDFRDGHDAGRFAAQESYARACKWYGAELSPLRDLPSLRA